MLHLEWLNTFRHYNYMYASVKGKINSVVVSTEGITAVTTNIGLDKGQLIISLCFMICASSGVACCGQSQSVL